MPIVATRSSQKARMASASRTASRSQDEQSSTRCLPHIAQLLSASWPPTKVEHLHPAPHHAVEVARTLKRLDVLEPAYQAAAEEDQRHLPLSRGFGQAGAQLFVTRYVNGLEGVAFAL